MPTSLPQRDPGAETRQGATALSERALLGWTILIPAALCVCSSFVPAALVLPALSIAMVGAAGVLAVWTWLTCSHCRPMTDLAGALLLVGFGASMLADVQEALRVLAEFQARTN